MLTLAASLLLAPALDATADLTPQKRGDALVNVTLTVKTAPVHDSCEDVNIKVTPIELLPDRPRNTVDREFITPTRMRLSKDGAECTGQSTTPPMAPGRWVFRAIMPSTDAQCVRYIAPSSSERVSFRDGQSGCA